jgi:hypothetical protein
VEIVWPIFQRCGTVTIYCGSGFSSDFGKVSVPAAFLVPYPDHTVFSSKENFTNFFAFLALEVILFPRKL